MKREIKKGIDVKVFLNLKINKERKLRKITYLFGACLPWIYCNNLPWLEGQHDI